MAIKCGNRMAHGPEVVYHDNAQAVKDCYAGSGKIRAPHPSDADNEEAMANKVLGAMCTGDQDGPHYPPTDRAVDYAMSLLSQREWPDSYTWEQLKGMEWPVVSDIIDGLKRSPRKRQSRQGEDEFDVPAGRYALDLVVPVADGKEAFRAAHKAQPDRYIAFFQVDKPTQGRWNGYTFVNRLYGAPGNFRKEPVRRADQRKRILDMIQRDPREASLRFGKEVGECGVCHSPLTNEQSRAAGIGPVCRGKMNW